MSNLGWGAIGLYQDTPMKLHERVIRTNLIGQMNDAHAVLPLFLEQGRGTFINIDFIGRLRCSSLCGGVQRKQIRPTHLPHSLPSVAYC